MEFKLGGYTVSKKAPPIFFAEVGSYFNGDPLLARNLFEKIVAARDANPDVPVVLKTEILDDPEICLPSDQTETYQNKKGEIRQENYRGLIERKAMPLKDYEPLFAYCRDVNIPTVVSVYDFKAADFAESQGAAALKIASSNLVHVPLIQHVAAKGLPMVIDTGRATLREVARAVEAAQSHGASKIIVQHSPDGHPALPEAHNLRILQTYEDCFGLPTGLSDHYVGIEMLYMSIALGATVLEKGLYFDPDELDQDISYSMHIDDLPEVLRKTMDCWLALGSKRRNPAQRIKGILSSSQRQCLVAKKDLTPGMGLSFETVRFAWPCLGIPVEHWPIVANWNLKESVPAGDPIQWYHVEAKK